MSELEPLDDELRALLEAAPPPAEPPPEVVDRVLARVQHTLSLPTPPSGDPPSGDAPPGAGASATAGALKATVLAGVFAMGAIVGGAVVAALEPAHAPAPPLPPSAIVVDAPRAEAPPKASAPAADLVPVVSIGSLPSAAPPEVASNRSAAARDDNLAEERAMIETARMAIARDDAEAALVAIDRHAARHPHGRLAQERDALRIRALVSAGRGGEAREHASRFRREYPNSFLLPVVNAALEGAP